MNKFTVLRSVLFSIVIISVFHGMVLAQNSIQLGISTSGQNLVVSAKPTGTYTGMLTGFAVTIKWPAADNVNLGAISSAYADKFIKSDAELVSGLDESQMFVLQYPIEGLTWNSGTEYPLFSIPINQSGTGAVTFDLAPVGYKSNGEGDPFIAFNNLEAINTSSPYFNGSTGFALPSIATSTISASPLSIVADGSSTSTITVQLKDASGVNITKGGWTVSLATTSGMLSSVTDNGNGTYTATLQSPTTVGSATITGTLNTQNITDNEIVRFTAGAATQIAVKDGNNQSAIAGTAVTTPPSVIVKDANNNPVSGVSVTFAVTGGGGSVNPTTGVTTDANGIAALTSWTLGTTAGSNTMTATSAGLTGSPVLFTATGTAGAATQIAVNAGDGQTATAGSAVAIAPSVIVKDANNNPVGGVSVTFAVATGGGSATGLSATTGTNGVATVGGWTLGTTAGTNTMTATSGTLSGSPVTFTASGIAGEASQIAIKDGDAQTATAGLAVQIKPSVIVRDANNNPVSGVSVTFAVATGGGTVSPTTAVMTDGSGIATVGSWTLGTTAGQNTMTATSGSLTVTFTATGTAGAATQIAVKDGNGQTAIAGSAVTTPPSVIVKDAHDNPVSGVNVTFAVTAGGGSATGLTPTTDANGIATVGSWTLGTTAGTNTMTATSAGLTGSPLTFTATGTAGAASVATSLITADPTSITADGSSTSTITVQLKDANNNNLTTGGATVALATTLGALSMPVVDHNNGTYTAMLTSATTVGTATITGTLGGTLIIDNATVAFIPGAASVATSTITANPTTMAANGTNTSTITVQLKDAHDNNLTGSGGTVVLATTAGTLGTVTDNNNGTYTAVLTAGIVGAEATISGTLNNNALTHTATVTMTQVNVAISGTVGVEGVTLSWMEGTTSKTATSETGGAYTLNVPFAWSGTITPTLTGYVFDPVNKSYDNVRVEQTAQNYTATSFVTVDLKAYLAGPFNGTTMTTGLNTTGRIPISSTGAYSEATYQYTASTVTAIPSTSIVDWVLVELRSGTAGEIRTARKAAFITNNGAIVGSDGTSPVVFSGVAHGTYYVVVRHRNHLPVMSSSTLTLNGPSVAYDFTTAASQAYGTNAMASLTGGVFGMYAGDINRDGKVKFTGTQNDEAGLIGVVGMSDLSMIVPGYNDADLNMDGNSKFTGDSNDNAILMGTVGLTTLTRIITTQVPN